MAILIQKGYAEKHTFNSSDNQLIRVDFKFPFQDTPLVHSGIIAFDDWNGSQIRLSTNIKKVHTHYIDIEIMTWNISKLYWVKVEWIAYGSPSSEIPQSDIDALSENSSSDTILESIIIQ